MYPNVTAPLTSQNQFERWQTRRACQVLSILHEIITCNAADDELHDEFPWVIRVHYAFQLMAGRLVPGLCGVRDSGADVPGTMWPDTWGLSSCPPVISSKAHLWLPVARLRQRSALLSQLCSPGEGSMRKGKGPSRHGPLYVLIVYSRVSIVVTGCDFTQNCYHLRGQQYVMSTDILWSDCAGSTVTALITCTFLYAWNSPFRRPTM